jgi:hypothetical protein
MSIDELIEELEMIRRRIQPRELTSDQYRAVGWADRPLRQLIDECRREQEDQAFADQHARSFTGAHPPFLLPEPLPAQATEASP